MATRTPASPWVTGTRPATADGTPSSRRLPRFRGPLADPLGRTAPWAFRLLRRHRPILLVRNIAILSRADDVKAVLGDSTHFAVPYGPRMTAITGPFILGLDESPLYHHDREQLAKALRAQDLPGLTERTLHLARERLETLPEQFDVVAD